jgi:hypothetical protein
MDKTKTLSPSKDVTKHPLTSMSACIAIVRTWCSDEKRIGFFPICPKTLRTRMFRADRNVAVRDRTTTYCMRIAISSGRFRSETNEKTTTNRNWQNCNEHCGVRTRFAVVHMLIIIIRPCR